MRKTGIVLMMLALVLGPGYFAYCKAWSGKTLGSYALAERGNEWTLTRPGVCLRG
jgi:hypothetical protein